MSRREFIKRSLESAVLLYCAVKLPTSYAAEPKTSRTRLTSLPAFVDTLIPADQTPSASQLGLDKALQRHAEPIENYTRLLELGCEWLDQNSFARHGKPFDGLSGTQREALVTFAEASAENTIPKIFFDRVRLDLFGLYYATPASWKDLGISSAPQPTGYLDYTKRPKRRTRG